MIIGEVFMYMKKINSFIVIGVLILLSGCLQPSLTTLVKEKSYGELERRVKNGESLDPKNNRYWSPLLIAANNGDIKMMKFLIKNGTNINFVHKSGTYPLYQFILYGYEKNDPQDSLEMVQWMVKHGANYKLVGYNNYTLIHISKDVALTKYLETLGLSVKSVTKNGATTLMGSLAYKQNGIESIDLQKYLIESCVDLNATAVFKGEKYTALDFAKEFHRHRALKLLKTSIQSPPKQCKNNGIIAPKVSFYQLQEAYNKENVIVNIEVEDQGFGVGDVELFVNGADTLGYEKSKIVKDSNTTKHIKQFHIKLQNGLNDIAAYAYDKTNKVKSELIRTQVVASYKVKKPELYALVIGIDEFEDTTLNLKYARDDAAFFGTTLYKRTKNMYSKVHIKYLKKKDETTRDSIVKALLSLRGISANDSFVFYVASHGVLIKKKFYIITSSVSKASISNVQKNGLSEDDLKNLFRRIPTANKLILIDACHAGGINKNISQKLAKRSLKKLNLTSITASSSQQVALEGYADGHGIFTYILTEALEGNADIDKNGVVQTMELVNYVTKMVPLEAKKYKHIQVPESFQSGQVFNVSLSRGFNGRVDMKPKYYNPKEIEKIKEFMKNNDLKSLKSFVENKEQSTEKIIAKYKKDESEIKKSSLVKAKSKKLDNKFKLAGIEIIANGDYIFLKIANKLKAHSGFVDPKGRNIIFFDFFSDKEFEKVKKELDTKNISNIYIASREGGWYRITLETKDFLEYEYEATKEWFLVKLKQSKEKK